MQPRSAKLLTPNSLTSFLSSSEELSVQYVTDILLFHLQAFFGLLVEQCVMSGSVFVRTVVCTENLEISG
jgi:hypothetical protein